MKQRYLIIKSAEETQYLDGFDGEKFEWTGNVKKAWSLDYDEAKNRLIQVLKQHPLALIIQQ